MREAIAKHGGYEIITEGDSFSVAFTLGVFPALMEGPGSGVVQRGELQRSALDASAVIHSHSK